MKRIGVILGLAILLGSITGCGSSADQSVEEQYLREVANARSIVEAMNSKLEAKVKEATEKNKKLKVDDFNAVFEEAKKLRDVGKTLIGLRAEFQVLKDSYTKEKREQIGKEILEKLVPELEGLREAEEKLDNTLNRALTTLGPDSNEGKRLKEEIDNSRQEFVALTRRR